jgi:hypothetical protein
MILFKSVFCLGPKRDSSRAWNAVCLGKKVICNGLRCSVSSLSSLDLICDPWVSTLPLSRWPAPFACNATNLPSLVGELINSSGQWDYDKVCGIFSTELTNCILNIPITLR